MGLLYHFPKISNKPECCLFSCSSYKLFLSIKFGKYLIRLKTFYEIALLSFEYSLCSLIMCEWQHMMAISLQFCSWPFFLPFIFHHPPLTPNTGVTQGSYSSKVTISFKSAVPFSFPGAVRCFQCGSPSADHVVQVKLVNGFLLICSISLPFKLSTLHQRPSWRQYLMHGFL